MIVETAAKTRWGNLGPFTVVYAGWRTHFWWSNWRLLLRNSQILEGVGSKSGPGVPPNFRFSQKESIFGRILYIPDYPENLSKKYSRRKKLGPKMWGGRWSVHFNAHFSRSRDTGFKARVSLPGIKDWAALWIWSFRALQKLYYPGKPIHSSQER